MDILLIISKVSLTKTPTFVVNNDSVFIICSACSENDYGGTGNKFNWEKIPFEIKNKIILAGGISSDNIEFIYKDINPEAVDLSSSLEITPGKKDKKKMKKFFNTVNLLRRQ